MIVVSPHLDDAVFGCGDALAADPGSIVVTVFAGFPADPAQRTDWDAACGFASAGEAVRERREEDRRALALLDATPVWLEFGDSQYGATPTVEAIAAALTPMLRQAAGTTVMYPLGLFHSDHVLVHDACMHALTALAGGDALTYEDVLYRALPGVLQQRLGALAGIGVRATPGDAMPRHVDAARKAGAVQAYVSQLRAFGPDGYADTRRPERCWRLERTPQCAPPSTCGRSPTDDS